MGPSGAWHHRGGRILVLAPPPPPLALRPPAVDHLPVPAAVVMPCACRRWRFPSAEMDS